MINKIVICSECEGSGIIECSELTDYHKRIYDVWDEKCETCKGSGRLIKNIKITTKPYKPAKIRKK